MAADEPAQPAEPAEPEREPVRPARPVQIEADPDLAAHFWPDGGMGHTGDVWMPTLHVEHMACGAYHPEVKAWCHREPRHQAHEIESRCRGKGADGQIYTWAVVDPE